MSDHAQVAELIDQAAALMQERSGGAAVCTFTKSGRPVPSLKHAEGRWAALREVQHQVRAGADLSQTVVATTQTWGAHLDRLRSRDAGADWIAYRSGGLDALAELAAALEPTRR